MLKTTFILIFSLLVFQSAQAQKDTLLYYMKNSGEVVDEKAEADYFVLITQPDAEAGTGLFPVYEYYPNGKRKLIAASKVKSINYIPQGPVMEFFANGKRKLIANYTDGTPVGNQTEYYPNGKIYALTQYDKDSKQLLMECRDSTGTVLAKNGEGKWLKFDTDFKEVIKEGPIVKEMEDGEWHETEGDSVKRTCIYSKGVIKSGISYKRGKAYPFKKPFIMPYSKTPDAFGAALADYYKALAAEKLRSNDAQSISLPIAFVVEIDGTLSNPKILYKISPQLWQLLISALAKVPKWEPGINYGIPTSMQATYSPTITTGLIREPTPGRGRKVGYKQGMPGY